MSEITDSGYAVLVVVALRGPSTAYEVKRALSRLAGEFWAVPHTQVYRECARLAAAGLLSEEAEPGGRRRRTLALTDRGRETVEAWVREPVDETIALRDVALLKVMAAELSTPEALRELARRQVAGYEHRLRLLDEFDARWAGRRDTYLRVRNIAMGRGVYTAALEFWRSVADDPIPDPPR